MNLSKCGCTGESSGSKEITAHSFHGAYFTPTGSRIQLTKPTLPATSLGYSRRGRCSPRTLRRLDIGI